MRIVRRILAALVLLAAAILPIRFGKEPESGLYADPRPVEIAGYDGVEMEPFISPDGRFLFFNNSNARGVVTRIRFAERTGPLSFRDLGELPGVNSDFEAVPSVDAAGHFFFTTSREYVRTRRATFTGDFDGRRVNGVHPAPGAIHPTHLGSINMDVGISPDGKDLYISRAIFIPPLPLPAPIRSKLMVARFKDGVFEMDPRTEGLMKNVNTGRLQYAPAVSPDGLELYFTRASVPGGMRILVATRTSVDEPFGEPRALSALSSGNDAEAPSVSTDLGEMFFHRQTPGGWRIFRATRGRPEAGPPRAGP